jgi:isopentenyl diphosphate isomerase/L-lactate dehydrogenase-like FMN-dependent dehydrogenase
VVLQLNQYAEQLRTAMIYAGCQNINEIKASVIHRSKD